MTDYINTIKALEATIRKFRNEDIKIRELLSSRKIRCRVSTASGVARLLKRMDAARKLLK